MALSNAAVLEKLCAIACTEDTDALQDISRDEALDLLGGLLSGHNLEEKVKRLQVCRRDPVPVYHLRYSLYFEILGHSGMIDRFCFDNSSTHAFSGSVDGTIKVWNVREGMLIRSLYGHSSSINDMSVSASGRYLASADYQGIVCVWDLKTFKLLHLLRMEVEVMFCEFFVSERPAGEALRGENKFACILVNGVVRVVTFTEEGILSIKENSFMRGESIKAICITDGGRFIICGGWWQFILVYDTHDLGGVYVLEEFRPQALCASKNGLKIAASLQNNVYMYTFYSEGDQGRGNFKKRRSSQGYWRRAHHTIPGTEIVERICFLHSFLLVTVATDSYIRIYDDEREVVSAPSEVGSLHAHPFRNIFAVVGTRICMYEIIKSGPGSDGFLRSCCARTSSPCINETTSKGWVCLDYPKQAERHEGANTPRLFINKFFDEALPISANDCEFSHDGRYFITSDDRGVIRAYSIEEPIATPEQQFFEQDFAGSESPIQMLDHVAEAHPARVYGPRAIATSDTSQVTAYTLLSTLVHVAGSSEAAVQEEREGVAEDVAAQEDALRSGEEVANVAGLPILGEFAFDFTEDINGNVNQDWRRLEYDITAVEASTSIKAEELAAEGLKKERLDFAKFNQLFTSRDEEAAVEDDSSSDVTWTSAYSISGSSEDEKKTEDDSSSMTSLITQSSGSSGARPLLLRSRVHKVADDEESHGSVLRRSSRLQFSQDEGRGAEESGEQVASEDDESTADSDTASSSSFVQPVTSKTRRASAIRPIARGKSRPGRTRKIVGQMRQLESSNESEAANDVSTESGGHNTSTRRGKTGRAVAGSGKGSGERGRRRLVFSEDSTGTTASDNLGGHDAISGEYRRPAALRRLSRGGTPVRSTCDSESAVPSPRGPLRRDRRRLVDSEELSNTLIDPHFEQELTAHAKRWLSTFSVYQDDVVYFDSAAYLRFIELESRLGMFDVPGTGIHTVERARINFIGSIPYLSMRISGANIAFYEYPKGTGILCLEAQWKAQGYVNVIAGDKLAAGKISETDGLLVKIKQDWLHRAFITVRGDVKAQTIEFEPHHRLLFGRQRGNVGSLFDVLNYDAVNTRLSLGLYRSYGSFLKDLLTIKNAAKHPHAAYASKIYNSYRSNV